MPQRKRKYSDIGAIVGAPPKQGKYSDIGSVVGGPSKGGKYGDIGQVVGQPQPQEPEGMLSSFQLGVAGPLLRNVVEAGVDLYNRPLETLQRAGRGALEFASAFDPAGNAYDPTGPNAQRIAELRRQAEAERPENIRMIERGMQEEEARPRTTGGRIAFGTGRVLGEAAFPTAPENIAGNIITAPFAGAALSTGRKFVAPILQRIRRGRGAATTIEEALRAPVAEAGAPEIPPIGGEVPPVSAPKQPATVIVNGEPHRVTVSTRDMGDGIRVTAIKLHNDATGTYRQIIPPDTGARFGSFDEAEAEATRFVQQAYGQPNVAAGAATPQPAQLGAGTSPTVQRAMQQFEQEVARIKDLPASEQPAAMNAAIQRISSEASGVRPVSPQSRAGYPPPMEFPENPNLIQQAGRLPGEAGPPPLEAEIGAPEFGVKEAPEPSYRETTGPSLSETAEFALPSAQTKQPISFGKAAAAAFRTPAQIYRSFRTAFDLSAAGNQGAVLSRAHPIQAFRAFRQQLRAMKPANRQAIDDAIINDPLTKLGRDFNLHIATGGEAEEAFLVKQFNKIPGIKGSEATYRTYLDTLRLSVWKNYVKALDSWGYRPENNPTAYKQVAEFINIATGRGSLKPGGALDKAMALGGDVLFAPRNLAAKFQLLDPVRYATLAPGARRLVLQDALTSFGSIIGAATLLRAAGVKVGFDPRADDFLTARFGNHRYDLTAGLKTEVRFLARMVAGSYNQFNGEGNLPAEKPLTVAKNYARQKLTPALGVAYDAYAGTDIKGQKFSDKSAADIAFQFAPMIAEDLREGYKDSGLIGMAMSSPAFVGQRVSAYPDRAKAGFIATPDALRAEQQKAGESRWFLQARRAKNAGEKDETPEEFAARLDRVNTWTQDYGERLIASPAYQNASPDLQKDAREHLKRVIVSQSSESRPQLAGLSPAAIIGSVKQSAARKQAEAKKNAARK